MKPSQYAKQIVKSILIEQKVNPGIKLAKKKVGSKFINRLLKKKKFTDKYLTKSELKKVKKLMDFKYGPLVYKVGKTYKVKPTVGESVKLAYANVDPICEKIAKQIREECWKRGCGVLLVGVSDADAKRAFQLSPESSAVEYSPRAQALTKYTDVRVYIGYDDIRTWTKGIEKKVKLAAPVGMKNHEIADKAKQRWCLSGWPVNMKKSDYVVPKRRYDQIFKNCIDATFTKKCNDLINFYYKKVKGADKIRIIANDGTDLSFRIKGRPVLDSRGFITKEDIKNGDIGLNIPDGEVFVAPLENSANGKIRFDYAFPEGFGLIRNLWLTFKGGTVVKFKGDGTGTQRFRRYLNSNTGDIRKIAEFGIGCNPAAKFIGSALIDEKIYGSIHIAIGNNTGAYHGKNKASDHRDFIKMMVPVKGNFYADGKLIMKSGKPNKS